MLLYRIIFSKYAEARYAPGFSGRWNREGERVLYTSNSPSLAMSETMAHRLGQGLLTSGFSLITFKVPDEIPMEEISPAQLPADWRLFTSYRISQPLGSAWYQKKESLFLKDPSAVVPAEYNVLINTSHPAFEKVCVEKREAFPFDERFISIDEELKIARSRKSKRSKWDR